MKDYLMFNKIKLTYNLIKLRIYDFFHPDMSYTIDSNTYLDKKIDLNKQLHSLDLNKQLHSHVNAKMHHEFIIKHDASGKEIVYNKEINDSMFFTHLHNEPIKKTFVIPIGDINKKQIDISHLISDYKSEIEFDEHDGEIFFVSNKKEDLN